MQSYFNHKSSIRSHPFVKECTQLTGDIIYVPEMFGHETLNLSPSIGVAIEFVNTKLIHGMDSEVQVMANTGLPEENTGDPRFQKAMPIYLAAMMLLNDADEKVGQEARVEEMLDKVLRTLNAPGNRYVRQCHLGLPPIYVSRSH